jgi:hypothetical protein
MNSLVEEEEQKIHQLETMDVVEEKDGIIISEIYEGETLFISDDEIPFLYEILKNRLLNKS